MQKGRLTNLPAKKLVSTLQTLQDESDAGKEPQRTSSVSGVLGYETASNNTWDATGSIGSDSDTGTHEIELTITWVGDGSQAIAFASLSIDLFVNGTDTAHQLTPATSAWTDGTRSATVSYNALNVSQYIYSTTLFLQTYKAITYYAKAFAVGSCPGTISVGVTVLS